MDGSTDMIHPLLNSFHRVKSKFNEILTLDFLSVHFQDKLTHLQASGFESSAIFLKVHNNSRAKDMRQKQEIMG
jgi:hypothetical protein